MYFKRIIIIIITGFFIINPVNAQYKITKEKPKINFQLNSPTKLNADEKKNAGVSMLLSLVIPGAGHLYSGRMDVGKYFVAAEIVSWLGVFGLNLYGNSIRDDSRSYALVHSGLTTEGKDDDYFSNVGNYNNIYDYNNAKLQRGEYDKLYDVNSFFWNWDEQSNKDIFETQRKRSERIYNSRIIFASGLILNRITSAISALILTNKYNKGLNLSFRTEFISNANSPYDGIKLNLIKGF